MKGYLIKIGQGIRMSAEHIAHLDDLQQWADKQKPNCKLTMNLPPKNVKVVAKI
jgi:hypothetical protein